MTDLRRRFANRDVSRALSIAELRHMARRRLPAVVFEYLEGGAEDEITLRRNRQVYEDLAFLPRILNDVSRIDPGIELFGRRQPLPFAIGPTGFNGLLWHQGDLALARAAAAAGIPFGQSTVSNAALADVAGIGQLRHWMQIYVFRDMEFMDQLVRRASDAGTEALILTVDSNVFGNREWDRRNYQTPVLPRLSRRIEALTHPRWLREVYLRGIPGFGNLDTVLPEGERTLAAAAHWSRTQIDPGLSWHHVDWLRRVWSGKLLVKGVMAPQDALRLQRAGVDGVILSNHGGRQLDGAVSALQVLPDMRKALGPTYPILIDGGIRRGADIVKARILGADAVLLGRATLYGLASGGEAGATRAIAILQEEVNRVLGLLGVATVAALTRDHLRILAL